jgi:hypothetical protein
LVNDAARVVMLAMQMPNGRRSPKNRGRLVHIVNKIGDGLSVLMGMLCHGDGSSRRWIVQGTDRPGDASFRGRFVRGRIVRGRIVRGRIVRVPTLSTGY